MLKGETCAVIRPAQPLRELLYPAVEKLDNGFIPGFVWGFTGWKS
jgi:hypothetical protein